MSAVFGRRRRRVALLALSLVLVAVLVQVLGSPPARADSINVNMDEARVLKLPEHVATIVIGNPLIADASLQSGGMLVITGKSYGSTNLIALDRSGKKLIDKTIQVVGAPGSELVVVFKGVDRESYSCTPECQRRVTLGDVPAYFNDVLNQAGTRATSAQTAPPAR
jgi:hypothetical protein